MTKTKLTSSTAPIPEPETSTCSACGAIHPLADLIAVEGYLFCRECLDRETVICSHCRDRILFDDNAGTEDFPLCQNCYR